MLASPSSLNVSCCDQIRVAFSDLAGGGGHDLAVRPAPAVAVDRLSARYAR